uniref:Uncharacterized protein n=1 Tax=Panagrolaimus superbus TaxID=310955 RepID=A0A914YDW1_9BILA
MTTQSECLRELQKNLESLTAKLGGKEPPLSTSGLQLSNIPGYGSPLASSTPIRKTPNYRTDPITKLHHLTTEGRKQVLRRQAGFDFSPCATALARISPHSGPLENEFILKLMCHLSEKYSDSKFTRYLRSNNRRTIFATILSKIFLVNPYANRYVPVYTRNVEGKLPQLNLRFIASYPFIIASIIVLWVLISFIMGFMF